MTQNNTRYVAQQGLSYAYWDGEQAGAVYNRRSGDTFLVNLVGLYILQNIVTSPASLPQVCHAVADIFELEQDEQLDAQVRRLLLQLSQQGLIHRFLA